MRPGPGWATSSEGGQPVTEAKRFERACEIFELVRNADPSRRADLLGQHCHGDSDLLSDVEAMLSAHNSESPLDQPITHATAETRRIPAISRYEIGDVIGEGGMGLVYSARLIDADRTVAVKVIRSGMDTERVINRFDLERQALARMDHPGIASVLDAGVTDDGRPFFAMELVRGERITHHCELNRLGARDRVGLVISICNAIQHAHQKGVIHRDIKPSNILVAEHDGKSVPKVIDFGIAKAIGGDALPGATITAQAQAIGTPAYMSPEQAAPDKGDIDTRTDVYSIGVLLYELLTGSTPITEDELSSKSFQEVISAIQDTTPAIPSSRLSRDLGSAHQHVVPPSELVGDLDWIVLKCLEKDRARRYTSVGALADDLQRFLDDEPVLACPPSRAYRVKKFVRRHRLGVSISAASTVVLASTLVVVSVLLSRTLEAERNSRLAKDEATAFNQFLLDDMIGAASPQRVGHSVTVVSAIERALQSLDTRFAEQPVAAARIRSTIGGVYHGLGLLDGARLAFEQAAEDYSKLLGPNAPETLQTQLDLTSVLHHMGHAVEAEVLAADLLNRSETTLAEDDLLLYRTQAMLGEILQARGEHNEAEPLLRNSIDGMRAKLSADDELLLASLGSLGASLSAQNRLSEAEPIYQETLRITLASYPLEHPASLSALNNTAVLLVRLGKPEEAQPVLERLVDAASKALPEGHWQVAWAKYSYAACLIDLGEYSEAVQLLRESYRDADAALGSDHHLTERALGDLVFALNRVGDPSALEYNKISLETRIRVANPDQRASVAKAMSEFAARYSKYNSDPAGEVFESVSETATAMIEEGHPGRQLFTMNFARGLFDIGEADLAELWLQKCYTLLLDGHPVEHQTAAALADDLSALYDSRGQMVDANQWRELAETHRQEESSYDE